ncbi:MAG TPA: single-stranded DNA-binding protein [Candidatus Korarchaeota archaeon]|nr:MAG: single-stranded DNA-binding protein [Candidatus Korarchaeota archaeon]HDI86224.1 single-stranded DNA-binding protein [Candidatus Korarchaeota archaeon]
MEKKISDLRPGEDGVNVKGRVLEVGETRDVETRSGFRTLSEAVIGDETGRIKLTLWGEHAGSVSEGQVIEVQNGFTTAFRGKVQLNVGQRGAIRVLEDSEVVPADQIPEESPEAPEGWRPRRRGGRGYGRSGGYYQGGSSYRRPRW